MDNTRPLILITNDDSIEAPGLHTLVDIAKEFGDIYVVARLIPIRGNLLPLLSERRSESGNCQEHLTGCVILLSTVHL